MESAFWAIHGFTRFAQKWQKRAEKTAKVLPLLPHILFATTEIDTLFDWLTQNAATLEVVDNCMY